MAMKEIMRMFQNLGEAKRVREYARKRFAV